MSYPSASLRSAPPETLRISAKAKELAAHGIDVMGENVEELKRDQQLQKEDRDV